MAAPPPCPPIVRRLIETQTASTSTSFVPIPALRRGAGLAPLRRRNAATSTSASARLHMGRGRSRLVARCHATSHRHTGSFLMTDPPPRHVPPACRWCRSNPRLGRPAPAAPARGHDLAPERSCPRHPNRGPSSPFYVGTGMIAEAELVELRVVSRAGPGWPSRPRLSEGGHAIPESRRACPAPRRACLDRACGRGPGQGTDARPRDDNLAHHPDAAT